MKKYISEFSIYSHKGIELIPAHSIINKTLLTNLQNQQADRRIFPVGKSDDFLKDISNILAQDVYSVILREKETRDDLFSKIKLFSIPACEIEALEYCKEKDPYTYRHLLTVFCLSLYIDSQLKRKNNDPKKFFGSLSHDIGKFSVPLEILQKKTPLTKLERKHIEHHTIAGYVLLTYFSGKYNDLEAIVARDHHEKNNGSGYPVGRKRLDLNTEIVIACDIYDALLSPRAYRENVFDNRTALEELSLKALQGKISKSVVQVLIAGNRQKKTLWQECEISGETRGVSPKDNNYGKLED